MMDETFEHNRKSKNYEMGQIKSIFILSSIMGFLIGTIVGLNCGLNNYSLNIVIFHSVFIIILWSIINTFLDILWFENEYNPMYTIAKCLGFGLMIESMSILMMLFVTLLI